VSALHPVTSSTLERFLDRVAEDGHAWTTRLTWKTRIGTFLATETAALRLDRHHRLYVLVLVKDMGHHRQGGR
jgi:hypothetical protein